MADLPIENKIDLKDALDKLVRTKQDAIQVMIYMTLRWNIYPQEIQREVEGLKLKSKEKIIVLGKLN